MKKYLLVSLTLLTLTACKPRAESSGTQVQKNSTSTQPLKVVADEDNSIEKDLANESDHEDSAPKKEPNIEITPETELYYEAVTKKEIETMQFPEYRNLACIEYLKEGRDPWYRARYVDESWLRGDAVVLVNYNNDKSYRYCENGKLSKYNDYQLVNVDILYSFSGPIQKGNINLIGALGQTLPNNSTSIVVLHKTKHNDYLIVSFLPANIHRVKNPYRRSSTGGVHSIDLNQCTIIDIPSQIGKITNIANSFEPSDDFIPQNVSMLLEELTQSHGSPGTACDIEEDERREKEKLKRMELEWRKKEKEIEEYTRGKRVPCEAGEFCPAGYMIEDLEVGEYMEKLNKVERIIKERNK